MLDAATVEEMWFPQVMYYPDDWMLGWGLGLMLYNHDGAIYGGHGGAMAGHLAGVFINRKTQIGAAGAHELRHARRHGAVRDRARREGGGALAGRDRAVAARGRSRPPTCARCSGRWWSEGNEFVFWWQGGTLQGEGRGGAARAAARRRSSATATAGARPRAASAASGCASTASRLIWAGYAFTRAQEPFTALSGQPASAYATTTAP